MSARKLQVVVSDFVAAASTSGVDPTATVTLTELPAGISQQLADAAFGRSQWREAFSYYLMALRSGEAVVDVAKCLLFAARSALYLGEHRMAQTLLGLYADGFPQDPEGLFYLGRAYQAVHRDHEALSCFNAASLINPGRPKYLAALAQAAHAIAFEGYGFAAESAPATYIAIARSSLNAALAKEPDHLESLTEQMLLALDVGELDKALATFKVIADKESKHGPDKVASAATSLALAFARGGHENRIGEISYLEKYGAGRRLLARAKALKGVERTAIVAPIKTTLLHPEPNTTRWTVELIEAGKFGSQRLGGGASTPAESVSVEAEFVAPIRLGAKGEITALAGRLRELPAYFAGIVTHASTAPPGTRDPEMVRNLLIRKEAWNELVAQDAEAGWEQLVTGALDRLKLFIVPQVGAVPPVPRVAKAKKPTRPRVIVLSRHGPRLVGGGEQFLRIAGNTYAANHGAEVFFAGLTRDWTEATAAWPAGRESFKGGFVYDDVDTFRAFCLANQVTAIHVISGLGDFVLDACRGLDIKLIYGVHFWREFIPSRVLSRPYYPNVGLADAKPLAQMEELLERGDFVYVNSDMCADMSRQAYRWSPPIIYSVPIAETPEGQLAEDPAPVESKNFVLLVNARADKGWYLLLDIAERLPGVEFVAIAGQSDRGAALADVGRRRLTNVRVIDRTDRMDQMYRAAKLVVVPSFSFVETFSRVVIEAGRFAKPVLMAESGNLTYLGAGTDLVLPNDAAAWAERIGTLMSSPKAYRKAVEQIVEVAEKYTADTLVGRLNRIPVRRDQPRILVCAGSGVGNICHVSPMVKKLATHYGRPVDVLVAGDFAGSSAAMAGSEHVAQVFETLRHVAMRQYDIVLVTHSFGTLVPSFNAYRVLSSRDFGMFEPGGNVHESEFNLAFLKQALGIDYSPAETQGYFFGDISAVYDASPLGERKALKIGLHAGSKGGIWAAKRWPGFARLAGSLIAGGAEVVSVGIKSEYVDGTLDKTDLTIARMAEEISTCDAMVSNDSGVMNIANALGIPLVALFGPTNPVTRGPINSPVRILSPGTDCAPCEAKAGYKSRFDGGKCQCISLISVSRVMDALRELGVNLPVAQSAR